MIRRLAAGRAWRCARRGRPLEEGEYYHVDLIGLPCMRDAGEAIGTVVAVENFGAGDILEIEKPGDKRFMVPIHATQIEAG
ncbi:MAG: PRC-barrel domain-containing protein [Sphingobium sp.]|nr:PRC-barrel domain-containing protein [Sphingobium sp.]